MIEMKSSMYFQVLFGILPFASLQEVFQVTAIDP